MQVIIAIALLILPYLGLAEAGLVKKAPRTGLPVLPSDAPGRVWHQLTITPSTHTPTTSPTTTPTPTASITTPTGTAVLKTETLANGTSNARTTTTAVLGDVEIDSLVEDQQKFIQTTYWSCVAFARETHCGWHEPILDASSSAARTNRDPNKRLASRVVVVVAVLWLFA
jgi:hypothetical protein